MASNHDETVLELVFDPEYSNVQSLTIREDNENEETKRLKRMEQMAIQRAEENNLDESKTLLDNILMDNPEYASAYNNRAQVFRLMEEDQEAFSDLNKCIDTLSTAIENSTLTKFEAKVLGQAYTQRAALLRNATKDLFVKTKDGNTKHLNSIQREDAAANDLFLGAKYGNMVAKQMKVHANPYAKLCGNIVKAAMETGY